MHEFSGEGSYYLVLVDFTAESQKILTKSSPKGLSELIFPILWMFGSQRSVISQVIVYLDVLSSGIPSF